LLVLYPTSLKECGNVMTQNLHRAIGIAGGKSGLDPSAHGILVLAKQIGDLFYRVTAMDFDQAMVGMTFSHESALPR
jgi:hypothetical protein